MTTVSPPMRYAHAPERPGRVPTGARPEPRRPPLEVVVPGFRSQRARLLRRRAMVAGGVLGALATVFGLVLVHVELTANQQRLSHLQAQADQARVKNLELHLQVAQLQSPARVVANAQQLGMVPPPSITYLAATPSSARTASTSTSPPTSTSAAASMSAPSSSAAASSSDPAAALRAWATAKHADSGP